MATRIINKLYNCFDVVEGIATSIYDRELDSNFHRIETSFEHVDPPVKRATKNLESLIKALNKKGYTVSISQIFNSHKEIVWSCFIHDEMRNGYIIGKTKNYQKTAYLAIKEAMPQYGWFGLE